MSEKEEKANAVPEAIKSFVDEALGGETHSQDIDVSEARDAGEAPSNNIGEKDSPFTDDSAVVKDEPKKDEAVPEEKKAPEAGVEKTKEVENLEKRFHDTQKAYHEKTEEVKRLERELLEARNQKSTSEESDSWFEDEGDDKKSKADADKRRSEEIDSKLQHMKNELTIALWEQEARFVRKEHPDFNEVVFDKLSPLLDETTGDAFVKSLWAKETDKSPANAYNFAKRVFDQREMLNDPEAYKEKLRAEIEEEARTKASSPATEKKHPTGKTGLDMISSAIPEVKEKNTNASGSFVGAVFN